MEFSPDDPETKRICAGILTQLLSDSNWPKGGITQELTAQKNISVLTDILNRHKDSKLKFRQQIYFFRHLYIKQCNLFVLLYVIQTKNKICIRNCRHH